MEEKWKRIDNAKRHIEVSNLGRFRWKLANGGYKLLSIGGVNSTRKTVTFKLNNSHKYSHNAGKLVAEYFVPNPNRCKFVGYKNGDANDLRATNLIWLTTEKRRQLRTVSSPHIITNGEQEFNSYADVYDFIKTINKYKDVNLDTVRTALSRCVHGERKKAYGYAWSLKEK